MIRKACNWDSRLLRLFNSFPRIKLFPRHEEINSFTALTKKQCIEVVAAIVVIETAAVVLVVIVVFGSIKMMIIGGGTTERHRSHNSGQEHVSIPWKETRG